MDRFLALETPLKMEECQLRVQINLPIIIYIYTAYKKCDSFLKLRLKVYDGIDNFLSLLPLALRSTRHR